MPTAAFAQSTGSVEFEKEAIVVTGTRTQDVGGVQTPDTPKAKAVLTQEMIARSSPGQTVLDTINVVPGVSFQNNDAYGTPAARSASAASIRPASAYTFDGIQLNDSGNYPSSPTSAARPRADRAGQRQPRLDRRRLADRLGRRRHRQPAHAHPRQGIRRPRQRLARRVRLSPPLRHVRHRRVQPVGHARLRRRAARRSTTIRSTITASSTSSSTTPRSTSRSAPTATSSRSPATTTRTATTSSARCRCART